jgi:glucosyl-dolichyl phosphate glucuronosyltransferase
LDGGLPLAEYQCRRLLIQAVLSKAWERELNAPHSDKVNVTAIICTRNRASQLNHVLETACHLVVPSGLLWELIVVDNCSSDYTEEVIRSYVTRLPVRYLREEIVGISNARNRGVTEARGEYICWTDDDVSLDPYWLVSYVEAFERHAEAAVFGGRILPVLMPPTPKWFAMAKDNWPIRTVLAARDFGNEITPVTFREGRTPYGANFAVRAVEQHRHKYNPSLGTSPTQRRVGEETDVIYRILKEGGTGWWVPDAKVSHIIQPQRQTLRYIYYYYRNAGESFAYLQHQHFDDDYFAGLKNDPAPMIRNGPYLYKQLLVSALGFVFYHLVGKYDLKLLHLRNLGYYCGILSYWRATADKWSPR